MDCPRCKKVMQEFGSERELTALWCLRCGCYISGKSLAWFMRDEPKEKGTTDAAPLEGNVS